MYAAERQRHIVSMLREHDRVAVADLADRFGVTMETIRRDLETLDDRGLVHRVHGGAVPREEGLYAPELAIVERETVNVSQKAAIARRALDFLPAADGSILLDGGTTTGQLISQMPDGAVATVITNSVPAAAMLSARDGASVQMLGGRLRGLTQSVVGGVAAEAIGRLRVDVAFLGANGLSVAHGFSTPEPDEALVKRAMIAAARRSVALVDSTKIGVESLVCFARPNDIDVLVTDNGIADGVRVALTKLGMEVVVA